MPSNLDLVRSIYAAFERGDFSSEDWAAPEIEFVVIGGPDPGTYKGRDEVRQAWRSALGAFESYRVAGEAYQEVDDERVVVLTRSVARGKSSGVEVIGERTLVFHIREGKVVKLVFYFDPDRALVDLGLTSEGVSS